MIKIKTLEYLDLHECLKEIETSSNRPGLIDRVWVALLDNQLFDGNDSFGYVPVEDSHEDLISSYGQRLGDDFEAIKQAVSHIPLKEIRWLSKW